MFRRVLFAVVAAVLLATGCSTSTEPSPKPTEASTTETAAPEAAAPTPKFKPTPTPSPTPTEERSVRGNLVAQLGDQAIMSRPDGQRIITFAVTDITTTTEIQTEYGDPPKNGYFVILTIEGETDTTMTVDDFWGWNPFDFSLFTPDGTRVNEHDTIASYSAVKNTESLPSELGPGEKFLGKIAFDSPTEHGFVAFEGFEWEF